MKAHNRNARILWESGSIVCIATGFARRSANRKTGGMLQTFILPRHTPPRRPGATCGNCPLRNGACYVRWDQSCMSVWRSYKAGNIAHLGDPAVEVAGKSIRIGTAGDPALVPASVWRNLIACSGGHAGYTHQWRWAQEHRQFLMASVDSPDEQLEAEAKGWRTFRAKAPWQPALAGEMVCPSSEGKTCEECQACNGRMAHNGWYLNRTSVVIDVHGSRAKLHPAMQPLVPGESRPAFHSR